MEGIQNLKGLLFVTYAKTKAGSNDEVAGHGLGVVDVFLTDGTFFGRVARGGGLNAPWGLEIGARVFALNRISSVFGTTVEAHPRKRRQLSARGEANHANMRRSDVPFLSPAAHEADRSFCVSQRMVINGVS